MADDDLTAAIETNAAGPKSVTQDGGSATAHSLTEQIEADKYLRGRRALSRSPLGIRHVKLVPGGAHDLPHRS